MLEGDNFSRPLKYHFSSQFAPDSSMMWVQQATLNESYAFASADSLGF